MSNNNTPTKGELKSALDRIAPCVNTEKAREAFEMVRSFVENAGEPADSYEAIWNALQRIDTAAAFLPTYAVRHEGGIEAFTQNIVDAIAALATPTGVAADESTRALTVALPKALAWKLMGLLSQELAVCADPECRISSNPEAAVTECREALYAALKASGERPSAPAREGEKR